MRIVHIEDFFHPDAGYQINIVPKYLTKFGHENIIITSEMDKVPEDLTSFFGREDILKKDDNFFNLTGVRIVRLPIHAFVSGRAVFTGELFSKLKELDPDVIYMHGNDTLTGIRLLKKTKKLKKPIVTDSHMLEMASKNKLNKLFRWYYKKFITPIILKNEIKVIRTQDSDYVQKCLGIPLSEAPWISYGSDMLLFRADEEIKARMRREYGIDDNSFVVVYTGKLDEAKGGKLLAQAFKEKFNSDKKVVLVVVGNTGGEYGKEVEDIFASSQNTIVRAPTQKYIDLAKFYQMGDLSVFARQCSLSFYDAQACGLPVVSEDNEINVDRNSHENGLCFKQGDVNDFRATVEKFLNMPQEELKKIKMNSETFIRENYSYEAVAREYEKIIEQTVKNYYRNGEGK